MCVKVPAFNRHIKTAANWYMKFVTMLTTISKPGFPVLPSLRSPSRTARGHPRRVLRATAAAGGLQRRPRRIPPRAAGSCFVSEDSDRLLISHPDSVKSLSRDQDIRRRRLRPQTLWAKRSRGPKPTASLLWGIRAPPGFALKIHPSLGSGVLWVTRQPLE